MRVVAAFLLGLAMSFGASAEEYAVQGDKTPFPTEAWAEIAPDNPLRPALDSVLSRAFDGTRPPALSNTKAMVVIVGGRLAAERYAAGITKDTRLQSWSMAKSILHAALGLAIGDGLIDPDAPAGVPEWQSSGDTRARITVRELGQMTDGLAFREDYGDTNSEVMQMLFGAGRGDVGASAASARPLHAPGTVWSYSGGSANILSRVLRDRLGGQAPYGAFLNERLFKPLGMASAVAEFDAAGTWIASSYVHATARDFAKFGLLYLNRGFWEMRQLIPRDWVEAAGKPSMASKGLYGTLFWLNGRDASTGRLAISDKLPEDIYFARGFGGQLIAIAPSHDAVIVMLSAAYSEDNQPIVDLFADLLNAIGRR
jgi:CubicO group peptidase (beta-lactamase class C family)